MAEDWTFGPAADRMAVPAWLAEHERRFLDSGAAPVVPRSAATVILMRPALSGGGPINIDKSGFEVYAQRRAATMSFAPNMYAFPGGSVDPADGDAVIDWAGPSPAEWGHRLGLPAARAQAVVCAAVRELFEEAGVLLAGRGADRVVGDLAAVEWDTARRALVARELSLTGWLAEAGLCLRSDLLVPWARWLTPEFEPRRFDTFFFLARLPAGQAAREASGEADHTLWLRPVQAAGLPMLPPTLVTLRELAAFDTIDAALAMGADRTLTSPVMPRLVTDDEGTWFLLR